MGEGIGSGACPFRVSAADDAAEIVVLPIELLNKDDFGLQSVKEAVEKYKNEYANND